MRFFDYIKNIFLFLIVLQIAPPLLRGIIKQYQSFAQVRTQVGVIPLKGTISKANALSNDLRSFFKNPEIKAIVLKIDCNGGAAGSCEHIFNDIIALKAKYQKPIISLIENTCASGGYWIACATDYIIAPRTAIVGSIGATFGNLFQLKSFFENHNVRYESLTAGKYKAATDPFVDLTPESKEMLQKVLNDTYQTFITSVAQQRKLALNSADVWADAAIFTGAQAHEKGLIDSLGSSQTAIDALRDRAIIEGEIEWVYAKNHQSFLESFWNPQDDRDEPSLSARIVDGICSQLEARYAAHNTL